MNLSSLSPKNLWRETSQLVQRERVLTLEILRHLREIEDRRLYADYGFNSLRDMLVRGFNYSDGSAQRRVDSVRLLREHPALEEKIANGAFNLTNLSAAFRCFKTSVFTHEKDAEILATLENKTTKQAQRELAKVSPKTPSPDSEIPLDAEQTVYKIVVDRETHKLFQKLKGAMSHVNPSMSKNEMLKILCRLGLEKYDRAREPKRKRAKNPPAEFGPLTAAQVREVFQRDNGVCTICGSDHQVEVDHIVPRAMGGSNELSNLRLLLRLHPTAPKKPTKPQSKYAPHKALREYRSRRWWRLGSSGGSV